MKRAQHVLALILWLAGPAGLIPAALADPVVGDIKFERKAKGSDDVAPSVFSHWVHRVKYKCYVCHNSAVGFEMKAGATAVTMDDMADGKYCGACHKGKPAFAVTFETCNRCHRK